MGASDAGMPWLRAPNAVTEGPGPCRRPGAHGRFMAERTSVWWVLRPRSRGTALTLLGATLLIGSPLALATVAPLGAAAEEGSVVVSINGTPIDADVGQKVEGCTVVVEVTGLDPDPQQVNLGVTISAVAPTVPEGSTDVLVDEDLVRETEQGQLSADYEMDDLVDAFAIKTNGYRLAVAVTLDGASMGARELWLACGATQDGEPNRIVFEVQWLDPAGKSLTMPLDSTMPAGWRDAYAVHASSIRGTATCTIRPERSSSCASTSTPATARNPASWSPPASAIPTRWLRSVSPRGGCSTSRPSAPSWGGRPARPAAAAEVAATMLVAEVMTGEAAAGTRRR